MNLQQETLRSILDDKETRVRRSFVFRGQQYSGYIISSTDITPNFHWFFFNEEYLINTVADSIAFKLENGVLIPVLNYSTHYELVTVIREVVEDYLFGKPTIPYELL